MKLQTFHEVAAALAALMLASAGSAQYSADSGAIPNSLPKLGPKPTATGTLTVQPQSVSPASASAVPVTPITPSVPGEWKPTSNVVTTVGFQSPAQSETQAATSAWDKPATATPVTNIWQQTAPPAAKPVPSVAPPPASSWTAKPGTDLWK